MSSSDRSRRPETSAICSVQANTRGQRPPLGLRDRSLLHPPGQERCPGEFDIAHPGAGEPARLFLARRFAWDSDQPLLGDQDPVAEDLVLGEIE